MTTPQTEPGPRGSSAPAVLGLLLTLAAIGAVAYFAFYAPMRAGSPAGPPEVVQGGASEAPPPPAAPSRQD